MSGKRSLQVTARVWASRGTDYVFPEQHTELTRMTPNTAVAFSGGGMRSLSATMGQLRALTEIGVLADIRYVSSVSGGARAATPYVYYRSGAQEDAQFLGPVTEPGDITWHTIGTLHPSCLGTLATRDPTATVLRLLHEGVPPDRVWEVAAGIEYLQPFGLFDPARLAYFSLDEDTVDGIRARNPRLRDSLFYTVRRSTPPRPYLIVSCCFVAPAGPTPFARADFPSLEYTPLYVGNPFLKAQRFWSINNRSRVLTIGGGFLEPFAFGSPGPTRPPSGGFVRLPRSRVFTLAAVTGTATASFSSGQANPLTGLSPSAVYWPLVDLRPPSTLFRLGDAGDLENLGVLVLLRRKVERIVVFVNTQTKLSLEYDPRESPGPDDISYDLPSLFGLSNGESSHNQVFATSDWAVLVRALQREKAAGRPTLARTCFGVRENDSWGIDGGWSVQMLWVYNDRVRAWEEGIDPTTAIPALIELGNRPEPLGPFRGFPNYATEGQNGGGLLNLTPEQINLLADLSCWNITSRSELFRQFLQRE